MTVTSSPTGTGTLPYRPFRATVVDVQHPTPSFVRITFGGSDLAAFAPCRDDQRIKLVLPLADSGFRHFPRTGEWYSQWRALSPEHQNPIRTYTVLSTRLDTHEIDVDLLLHEDGGPASRWAARAGLGDEIVIVGPNRHFDGETDAAEWRPHPHTRTLLIGADATALPAAQAILAGLAETACGIAVLEVPTHADRRRIVAPANVRIDWRIQVGPPGAALEIGVREAARHLVRTPSHAGMHPGPTNDNGPDNDNEVLWDVPTQPDDTAYGLYAWLAGEAGAVTRLRRHLVGDLAIDRKTVAFMGYWRQGHAGI